MIKAQQLFQQAYQAASQGNFEFALMPLRELLSLVPSHARGHHLMATSLLRLGRTDEAISHAKLAAEIEPNNGPSRFVYAICLSLTGSHAESLPHFEVACRLAPGDAQCWNNYGQALLEVHRYSDAERVLRKGLTLSSQIPQLIEGLGWALLHTGRANQSLTLVEEWLPKFPTSYGLIHLRAMASLYADSVTPEQMLDAHKAMGKRLESFAPTTLPALPAPTAADLDRPLRVGFVSPDLFGHSVSRFLEPLLRARRESEMMVALLACQAGRDEITGRLETNSNLWFDLFKVNDTEAAAELRRQGFDILIDLAGYMSFSRISLLTHRPAHITMTYLGYPFSTGATRIDCRIVDSLTDPPEADKFATERLIRLDPCFLCFQPAITPPDVRPRPEGPITFGSFNSVAKFSPTVVSLWASILQRVPGSRLLLKSYTLDDASAREYLTEAFASRGVGPERIEMLGQVKRSFDHLDMYNRVDIALDSFPYHGTTTTCESLLMGVPVVTLEGRTHHARVGVSLLSAVGVPELIARTPEQYVDLAVELAQSPKRLVDYRSNLRARLEASPLMDEQGFARRFEALLRGVWREYCQRAIKS